MQHSIVEFTFHFFKAGDRIDQNTMDMWWKKEVEFDEIPGVKEDDVFADRYILKENCVCLSDYKVITDDSGEFGSSIQYDIDNIGLFDVFDIDEVFGLADLELKRLQGEFDNDRARQDELLEELRAKRVPVDFPLVARVVSVWKHECRGGGGFYGDDDVECYTEFVKTIRIKDL
jgi:hypothetical protein